MKGEPGFCVYLFTHGGGAGRKVSETNNMKQTKQQLRGPDVKNVVCDADKKTAIKKYNALVKKKKERASKKPSKKSKKKYGEGKKGKSKSKKSKKKPSKKSKMK